MRRYVFFAVVAGVFLLASGLAYLCHYLIFRDTHHIFIYLMGDLAFLPLEVLLVGLIIDRLLHRREKQSLLRKLNIVVGAFFSEVGNQVMAELLKHSERSAEVRQRFRVTNQWTWRDFRSARSFARTFKAQCRVDAAGLESLKAFLGLKRPFMLALMENPNLLEHEGFTDMLLAVFHLDEELEARQLLEGLPESDVRHIGGDIERAFSHVVTEWLAYAEHLKSEYPFLFSLVSRTHPLQDHPTPVVG
jgi:hypothetical protein